MYLFNYFVFQLFLISCKSQSTNFQTNHTLVFSGKCESIILYLYGAVLPYSSPTNPYCIQQQLMSTNHSKRPSYVSSRYTHAVKLIVIEFNHLIMQENKPAYTALEYIFMASDTVAIIADYKYDHKYLSKKCEDTFNINIMCQFFHEFMQTPSLKILLTFSMLKMLRFAKIVNNDDCIKTFTVLIPDSIYFINFNKLNLLEIHKRCFWNTMNHGISSNIPYVYSQFFEESRSKAFRCDIAFENHNFKEINNARYCWAKQMLASELSKIHNVTYVKSSNKPLYENDLTYIFNYRSTWYEAMYLQYYSGFSYIYCIDSKHRNITLQLGYDTFVLPMTLGSWALMALSWFTLVLFYTSLRYDGV